jgi:alpha-maltose-1-phosphate synthase
MSEPIKATIFSAYPFHMLSQAHQLARLGALDRLVTAVPVRRIDLPVEQIRTRPYWSGLRHIARRLVPAADHALSRAVVRDFDRWAIGQLGDPTVVNGLSGFATDTLAEASRRGIPVCCDRGSWHILEQKRVLDEEAERVGCDRAWIDPFLVDRELREYEVADRIIVPSELARQSFIRRGVDMARLSKVPYGVDISAFAPSASMRQPGAIVSVGTVGLRKGHRYLVQAFRSMLSPSTSLTLVGPIEQGWSTRLGLEKGDVRITGAVDRRRVIEELQRASIFALASVEEGLALVLVQAMACGLPVVATDATGVRELITHGVEGLVVPAGDSRALTEAFERLLAEPETARMMGEAARQRVESFGGWDRYGDEVVEVFRSVTKSRA